MAKKKMKSVTVRRNQGRERGSIHSWNKVSSKQAIMAARGFPPFDFLVRRLEELEELVVEIDGSAQIVSESRQKIVRQAQLILSGNVISKKAAQGKKDVAWVQASWAHPEGAGILDPISTFEVGVAVARNRRPFEECERAARFLKFEEELPEGLGMLPNEKGEHVNVPLLGILLKPNLVEVRRNGNRVGTASLWHTLIGFEERDRERFARPTREESLDMKKAEEKRKREERAVREEEEKARKDQETVDGLEECFENVWEEWEEAEEERKQAEKAEKWQEFIASNDELRDTWKACKQSSNNAYESDRLIIEALQLVVRPTPPRKADLMKALPHVRDYIQGLDVGFAKARWGRLMDWVKDTSARKGLSLSESLSKANADLPWLLPHWFVSESGSVSPLYPLKELEAYGRDEWVGRVSLDPIISDEEKSNLFSLAGEE